jgi:hypothetical protein
MSIIPAFWKKKLEGYEFKIYLGYIVNTWAEEQDPILKKSK